MSDDKPQRETTLAEEPWTRYKLHTPSPDYDALVAENERLAKELADVRRTLRQLRDRLFEVNAGNEMGGIDCELVATIDVALAGTTAKENAAP